MTNFTLATCNRLLPLALLALLPLGCQAPFDAQATRDKKAAADAATVHRPAPAHAITCQEAIAYGLTHNADTAVTVLETAIQEEARTGAKLKMLPELNLSMDKSRRSSVDASTSRQLFSRSEGSDPSFSEPKSKFTLNASFTWSLLDFGISYLRSRQAEDQVRIQQARLRRTQQNLALQITEVYWQAQVAQEAAVTARAILKDARGRIATIQDQLEKQAINRHDFLKAETALLETELRLRRYQTAYERNLAKLAALMGLPVGADLQLVKEDFSAAETQLNIQLPYEELEAEALRNRPEFFEHDRQEEIALREARIAMISLWPNASLFGKADYDSNPFLHRTSWYTVGLEATHKLLSIPNQFSKRRKARREADLARQRRTALLIGVIAQVRIAGLDYLDICEEYKVLAKLSESRSAFLGVLEGIRKARGRVEWKEILEARSTAHTAQVRRLEAFAKLKTSLQRIANTVGRNAIAWDNSQKEPPAAPTAAPAADTPEVTAIEVPGQAPAKEGEDDLQPLQPTEFSEE